MAETTGTAAAAPITLTAPSASIVGTRLFTEDPEETRNAERQRIQAILNLPEAEGRAQLAQTLAFEPGMTTEAARRILTAAPAQPPAGANALDRAMATVKNPVVGTTDENAESVGTEVQRILSFVPPHQRVKAS